MKKPTYHDFQASSLPITDLSVGDLVTIIDVVVDKKLDEKLDGKLAPIYARLDEQDKVHDEILNAIGWEFNRVDNTLTRHERRISLLEVKAT